MRSTRTNNWTDQMRELLDRRLQSIPDEIYAAIDDYYREVERGREGPKQPGDKGRMKLECRAQLGPRAHVPTVSWRRTKLRGAGVRPIHDHIRREATLTKMQRVLVRNANSWERQAAVRAEERFHLLREEVAALHLIRRTLSALDKHSLSSQG